MLFEASAPGNLMLLGEYGVLYGKPALVCAVDKRMKVRLIPRGDDQINIQSSHLGQLSINRSSIAIAPPFKFILAVLKKFQKKLRSGCDIEITSEFSSQIGLGSSAAVTAAILTIINEWLELSYSTLDLISLGRSIIQEVQGGHGSGADLAASMMGGIVSYQIRPFSSEKVSEFHLRPFSSEKVSEFHLRPFSSEKVSEFHLRPFTDEKVSEFHPRPFSVEKLSGSHPISVLYSGSKLPTPEAIAKVEKAFSNREDLFRLILQAIGRCAEEGKRAILQNDWAEFGKIMNIQQGLMESLGVSTIVLQELLQLLRNQGTILGAKISGSGFGDCVIGLGSVHSAETLSPSSDTLPLSKGRCVHVTMTDRGGGL